MENIVLPGRPQMTIQRACVSKSG